MAAVPESGPGTEDPADSPARQLAEAQLAGADTTWRMGDDATVEFARSPGEPVSRGPDSAVTARGGIRLTLPDGCVAIAYETPDDSDPLRWDHAVAFCVPEPDARFGAHTAVAELGPDADALRPHDTGGVLFDLGAGGPTVQTLVRTSDPDALAALRAAVGSELDDDLGDLPLGPAVHRVVRGVAGRIEVFGSTGRRHRRARPHPPTAPIPDGWVPCLVLRPPHPATDRVGHPMPFDHDRHRDFQTLLVTHGDPVLGVLKADVVAAVRAGRGPTALLVDDPAGRATVAVTVRQLAMTDGTSGALSAWRSRHGTA